MKSGAAERSAALYFLDRREKIRAYYERGKTKEEI